MIVDYDITVLVTATPPRHTSSKQVITAVTGRVDIPEIGDLQPAVTLSRYDGSEERRIYTSDDGSAFEMYRAFSPAVFTDGPDGLPYLRDFRLAVSNRLKSLPPSLMRTGFHPGSKVVSAQEFSRVDPWATGATPVQMAVIEQAQQRVESHLSEYVIMAGVVFRRVAEPFLILSSDEDCQRFKLSVETDVRVANADGGGFAPIACFGLGEARAARNYAASLTKGQRAKVNGNGIKICELDETRLFVDPVAMTFRAAAVRMYRGYVELAERWGNIEGALTGLPINEIVAFRQLADAISNSWGDVDVIDFAVDACLQYEENSGRQVFSTHPMVPQMLEIWNDRPIGVGLPGSSVPSFG
jgi:hypothetical protein